MDKYYKVFNDPDCPEDEILIVHSESEETICIIPAKYDSNTFLAKKIGRDEEKADLVHKALEAFRPE